MFEELILPLPRSTPSTLTTVDLAALVDTYAGTLFRVAHTILRNAAEAEDVVQDTFVRVLQAQQKSSGQTLPDIRDLRPWLIRIAWNLALDRRRRLRFRATDQADHAFLHTLAAQQVPADIALDDAQQIARVLQAIDRLPVAERQALLLSALNELSTPDIAQIMGKSDSAVRALLFRARTRLRDRLQPRGTR